MNKKSRLLRTATLLTATTLVALPSICAGFVATFEEMPVVGENGLYRWNNTEALSNEIFIATESTTPANPIAGYSGSLYSKSTTGFDVASMYYQPFGGASSQIGSVSVTFNTAQDGFNLGLGTRTDGDGISPSISIYLYGGATLSVRDVGAVGNHVNVSNLGSLQRSVTHTVTVEWDYSSDNPGFTVMLNGTYAQTSDGEILWFAPRPQAAEHTVDAILIGPRTGGTRRPEFFLGEIEATAIPEPRVVAAVIGALALGLAVSLRRTGKSSR